MPFLNGLRGKGICRFPCKLDFRRCPGKAQIAIRFEVIDFNQTESVGSNQFAWFHRPLHRKRQVRSSRINRSPCQGAFRNLSSSSWFVRLTSSETSTFYRCWIHLHRSIEASPKTKTRHPATTSRNTTIRIHFKKPIHVHSLHVLISLFKDRGVLFTFCPVEIIQTVIPGCINSFDCGNGL